MLTIRTSRKIIKASCMDAMYVTRNFFDMNLYTLDSLIEDFIDRLERSEIQEWAELIANQDFILSYNYEHSTETEVSFSLYN